MSARPSIRVVNPASGEAAAVWVARAARASVEWPAPADQDLVSSAQQAGWRLPRSCRNGTCRACLCRLTEGRVDYRVEWPGLSLDERSEGWILPCVALPRSDLVLDVKVESFTSAGLGASSKDR